MKKSDSEVLIDSSAKLFCLAQLMNKDQDSSQGGLALILEEIAQEVGDIGLSMQGKEKS